MRTIAARFRPSSRAIRSQGSHEVARKFPFSIETSRAASRGQRGEFGAGGKLEPRDMASNFKLQSSLPAAVESVQAQSIESETVRGPVVQAKKAAHASAKTCGGECVSPPRNEHFPRRFPSDSGHSRSCRARWRG